jgi:hypothetical protein
MSLRRRASVCNVTSVIDCTRLIHNDPTDKKKSNSSPGGMFCMGIQYIYFQILSRCDRRTDEHESKARTSR